MTFSEPKGSWLTSNGAVTPHLISSYCQEGKVAETAETFLIPVQRTGLLSISSRSWLPRAGKFGVGLLCFFHLKVSIFRAALMSLGRVYFFARDFIIFLTIEINLSLNVVSFWNLLKHS